MNVRYFEDEKHINIELPRDSNGPVFQIIANELLDTFNIKWKTKLDGFDQSYWDFDFKGIPLTLHEHLLGISIFAEKSKTNMESARKVLEELGDHFKTWNP